jgi:glycosyltransferase involved in cell wall biosynthesis
VLGYLVRLADAYRITLISFEKSEAPADLKGELRACGINWVPLAYHRRPPVLSTALDVLAGARALRRATQAGAPAIVHVRSYVAALIAQRARHGAENAKLLFDIRGFWVDERVDAGLWRRGGPLYRIAKRYERRFFSEADAIVTLTNASIPRLRSWVGKRALPIEVIPTCVDLRRFEARPERPGGSHAVWSGSLSTWYRFDLAPRLADALGLTLTVITQETDSARRILAGHPATVRSVAPDEMPRELFAGDIGLCLIASFVSKVASMPTRFAEYLAAGMPVIVTPGVGDLESVVEDHMVGVVLRGEDERSIADAANSALALAADRDVRERCRRLAREQFDVDSGSAHYASIYRRLSASQS